MDNQRYVCVECGASHDAFDVVPADLGVACPSCGGGCDPAEHECVGCGKDILSPHSWVWVDDDWCPLCEECSAIELSSSDNLIRCNKCYRILDRLMKMDNGCIMCIFDDISKITRQTKQSLVNKLNKVIEQSLKEQEEK